MDTKSVLIRDIVANARPSGTIPEESRGFKDFSFKFKIKSLVFGLLSTIFLPPKIKIEDKSDNWRAEWPYRSSFCSNGS